MNDKDKTQPLVLIVYVIILVVILFTIFKVPVIFTNTVILWLISVFVGLGCTIAFAVSFGVRGMVRCISYFRSRSRS